MLLRSNQKRAFTIFSRSAATRKKSTGTTQGLGFNSQCLQNDASFCSRSRHALAGRSRIRRDVDDRSSHRGGARDLSSPWCSASTARAPFLHTLPVRWESPAAAPPLVRCSNGPLPPRAVHARGARARESVCALLDVPRSPSAAIVCLTPCAPRTASQCHGNAHGACRAPLVLLPLGPHRRGRRRRRLATEIL